MAAVNVDVYPQSLSARKKKMAKKRRRAFTFGGKL
jgi:hypothetical protein